MSVSILCSNQDERYQPTSLLTLTTEFVARHLIYVESFTTISDIVGISIFQTALSLNQFESESSAALSSLEPFTLAYGQLVLEALTLNAAPGIILNRHLQQVKLFRHLVQLDLTGCGIDDYHEVIVHIGTQLHLLEALLLADNKLSDVGIQRLTAYSRVMMKGLKNLAYLDLSGNQSVTNMIFVYLKPFHRLVTLNLTGCSVSTIGKESLYSQMGFVASNSCPENVAAKVMNKGWAAPLIDQWRNKKALIPLPSSSSAAKFYSKKGQPSSVTQPSEPDTQTPLVFIRRSDCHQSGTSVRAPTSPPKVGTSKNPSGSIRTSSLRRTNSSCHSSMSRESLVATYSTKAGQAQKIGVKSDIEATHCNEVAERECKVVKNLKRHSTHSTKIKEKEDQVSEQGGGSLGEEPEEAPHGKCAPDEKRASHGKRSPEEKGREDAGMIERRKSSVFDYLD